MENIDMLFGRLTEKDNNAACAAMARLEEQSRVSNAVYRYMDAFAQMLKNKNSYARNRALTLIAANARWDAENKLETILEEYLLHISDPKPITSRICIKGLREIARSRPQYVSRIMKALENADAEKYAESMRSLVEKDIEECISLLREIPESML